MRQGGRQGRREGRREGVRQAGREGGREGGSEGGRGEYLKHKEEAPSASTGNQAAHESHASCQFVYTVTTLSDYLLKR